MSNNHDHNTEIDSKQRRDVLISLSRALIAVSLLLIFVIVAVAFVYMAGGMQSIASLLQTKSAEQNSTSPASAAKPAYRWDGWKAPDIASASAEVKYGRELIANTSYYLGPRGKVAQMSNGMNCQNCHLDAGTRIYGNNYSAVSSTYPKFRARSGSIESIEKRVNDCIQRSLNGKPLADNSSEMKAIVAYMHWLGQDVAKGDAPKGSGLLEPEFLERPADPEKGRLAFEKKCVSCHGANGEGLVNADGNGYTYPPLWGEHSYNSGAGLYRLSRFAGYVKANMPLGATHHQPQLSDEEAWDIAAFVNSRPRPSKDLGGDWPDISKKPFDHPFGPYADGFSEQQHKYGPFSPIKKAIKEREKKSKAS